MALSKLPDEMLQEFLAPTLSVPDEMFASTAPKSPFSSVSQSSSTLLLVCKGWLRVATPLLYRTVILRSVAQAQALADSLHANKALGRYIKKLRVEGGYGVAMHKILTLAPNITDLYLSLLIWSDDSVSGLCRSLSAINPLRVILYDDPCGAKFNAKTRQLEDVLCKCILKWSKLVNFHFPYYTGLLDPLSLIRRHEAIADALGKAPNLHIVSSPRSYRLPQCLVMISQNPSLKTIHIESLYDGISDMFLQGLELEANAKLRALLTFQEAVIKEPERIRQSNICSLPLQQVSRETQDKIWTKILGFALDVTEDLRHMPRHRFRGYQRSSAWRRTLLLVSKAFHRNALPHFYRCPVIISSSALHQFSERLVDDSSLGLHLRSFFIYRLGHYSSVSDEGKADQKTLMDIVSCAPQLMHMYGVDDPILMGTINWEVFCLLGATAGPSLLEFGSLSIVDVPTFRISCPLHSFTRLHSLYWHCGAKFHTNDESLRDCLPLLESLRISSCDPSFLELVSHINLPALSRLSFKFSMVDGVKTLLVKHGHKIRDLELRNCQGLRIFEMCPSLNVLRFFFDPMYDESLMSSYHLQHHSLKTIVMHPRGFRTDGKVHAKFFANLNTDHFPALREIRVNDCEWPTDMRKVSKSKWVMHSEALLEQGVTLTDKDGKAWRHRLKRSK